MRKGRLWGRGDEGGREGGREGAKVQRYSTMPTFSSDWLIKLSQTGDIYPTSKDRVAMIIKTHAKHLFSFDGLLTTLFQTTLAIREWKIGKQADG